MINVFFIYGMVYFLTVCIDVLRLCAIFMVICIHCSDHLMSLQRRAPIRSLICGEAFMVLFLDHACHCLS